MKKLSLLFLALVAVMTIIHAAQQSAAVTVVATWKDQSTQDRIVLAVSQAFPTEYAKFRRLDDADATNDRPDSRVVRTNFAERMAARHLIEIARGTELNVAGDSARTTKKAELDSALVDPPQ